MSNPNKRLKEIFTQLPVTYEQLAEESNISKSTWQRAMKSGGHIGIDILTFLKSQYGIDSNRIVSDMNTDFMHKSVMKSQEPSQKYIAYREKFRSLETTDSLLQEDDYQTIRKNLDDFIEWIDSRKGALQAHDQSEGTEEEKWIEIKLFIDRIKEKARAL